MSRPKLSNDVKKPKIGLTLNKELDEIMCDYLDSIGKKPSKYIEELIREDMIKRGYEIKNEFER